VKGGCKGRERGRVVEVLKVEVGGKKRNQGGAGRLSRTRRIDVVILDRKSAGPLRKNYTWRLGL